MNVAIPFLLLLLPVIDLAVWARTRRQDGEHQPLLRQLGLIQHLSQSDKSIVTNQRRTSIMTNQTRVLSIVINQSQR